MKHNYSNSKFIQTSALVGISGMSKPKPLYPSAAAEQRFHSN